MDGSSTSTCCIDTVFEVRLEGFQVCFGDGRSFCRPEGCSTSAPPPNPQTPLCIEALNTASTYAKTGKALEHKKGSFKHGREICCSSLA